MKKLSFTLLLALLTFSCYSENLNLPLDDEFFRSTMANPENHELFPNPSFINQHGNNQLLPVIHIYVEFLTKQKPPRRAEPKWMTCSGTVIGNNQILTAKHCLYSEDTIFNRVLVFTDLYSNIAPKGIAELNTIYQNINIKNVFRANSNNYTYGILKSDNVERYNSRSMPHAMDDVAVFEVDGNIAEETGALEVMHEELSQEDIGLKMHMTGFPGNSNGAGQVIKKYLSDEVCTLSRVYSNVIYTNCIPNSGISGSPLLIKKGDTFIVAGVNSRSVWLPNLSIFGSRYTGLKYINRKLLD